MILLLERIDKRDLFNWSLSCKWFLKVIYFRKKRNLTTLLVDVNEYYKKKHHQKQLDFSNVTAMLKDINFRLILRLPKIINKTTAGTMERLLSHLVSDLQLNNEKMDEVFAVASDEIFVSVYSMEKVLQLGKFQIKFY